MLKISGLYKQRESTIINDLTILVNQGNCVSIECSNDVSNLLVDLIIGKEQQAKGEISINGIPNFKSFSEVGIILHNDCFYEQWTIGSYIKFFADIINYKFDYKKILLKLALLDIVNKKIESLTYSQRRRLSFARELIKQPKLIIFQEPILNVDKETVKIIVENINELCANNTAILITSVNFKDVLMIGEECYKLDHDGLIKLTNNENQTNDIFDNKGYKIEKFPAKVEDKIILFDPNEIDYVESVDGQCNLYVRGESFTCNFSLNDLEERLKYFGFFRCHRSYLVNLQRVREVLTWTRNSYSLILSDKIKSTIPLAKGRFEELKVILKI